MYGYTSGIGCRKVICPKNVENCVCFLDICSGIWYNYSELVCGDVSSAGKYAVSGLPHIQKKETRRGLHPPPGKRYEQ